MKTLRPLTILVVGALSTGVAFPLIAYLSSPPPHDVRTTFWGFAIGSVAGLLFVAPIAIGEAIRSRSNRSRYSMFFRIHWIASLGMALAMGYLAASYVHHTFDLIVIVAMLIVFLGAMTKACVGIILKPDDDKRWWV